MRCYPILTPFKLHGTVAKPPAFVQFDDDEAQPYIDAGVIGADWVEAPTEDELEAARQAEVDAAQAIVDEKQAEDVAIAERAQAEQAAQDKAAADKAARDQAAAVKAAAKKAATKKTARTTKPAGK